MYLKFFKRIFDILLALFFLLPVTLVLLLFALLIKAEDGGKVFFCSPRLGKNGKVFFMYKLRSMKENAPDIRNGDASTYNAEDDPRQTRIGKLIRKTSIDEIPQLFNVLKGDMSFVGPRPDLPEHLALYKGNEFKKLAVKPGITGYVMAYYRNSIPWEEKKRHEVYYVEHIGLWLDMKIFFKTLANVAARKNIYISTNYDEALDGKLQNRQIEL